MGLARSGCVFCAWDRFHGIEYSREPDDDTVMSYGGRVSAGRPPVWRTPPDGTQGRETQRDGG
jgi:hypothetical protein